MNDDTRIIRRKRKDTQILSTETKVKVHRISYYLSRFEHDGLYGGRLNQGETFQRIADKLGVKATTLKNKRDIFDPFCSKIRIGWVQQGKLSDDLQEVYNDYKNKTKDEILKEIMEYLR